MGFTHYWYRKKEDHDRELWTKFVCDCIDIRHKIPDIELTSNEENEEERAIFDNFQVHFNGVGEDSHETFVLTRSLQIRNSDRNKGTYFGFCKTARKPYDIMVCACLILYKYYFGTSVQISSDGDWEDWTPALELITATLPHGKEVVVQTKIGDGLFERCLEAS